MSWVSQALEQGIRKVAPSFGKGTMGDENMEHIGCMGYLRSAPGSVGRPVWDVDMIVER